MTVRPAKQQDIEQIIEMGARMHAEGAYAFLPYDPDKVRRLIISYLQDSETRCGLVVEHDNALAGMLAGYLTDYFFCDEKLACDMVVFVDRPFRGSSAGARLIRAFRDWAAARGAREVCLGISSGVNADSAGKFYERMGLTHAGDIYKQRLG